MKVVITDYEYENIETERAIIEGAGFTLHSCQLKRPEELLPVLRDADAVITQYSSITSEVIEGMEHCRMIIKYGIGVNNIDCDAAAAKGILVCNVPDYGISEVSDHTCAMILALGRKLMPLAGALKSGGWGYSSAVPLKRLSECTLGLVGFGRIPQMAAKKMRAFGMRVSAYDPFVSSETAAEQSVNLVSLDELLRTGDFISVHCPLTRDTFHLIGKEEIEKMKASAFLINTARGGIIDEKALITALKKKRIAGAGIDVFEEEPVHPGHPLLSMDNVIATPHSAWYSETAIRTLQRKAAEEVVNVLKGNKPFNRVV